MKTENAFSPLPLLSLYHIPLTFCFFNHRKVSLPLTQLVLPLAYRCVWNGLSAEARHSVSTEFKKTGLLPIFMPDLSLRFLPSTSIFMKFN